MAKKFKPKINKRFMECDICERYNLEFIINLKAKHFSQKGTVKERKARRVCFYCGFSLFKLKIYNFSFVLRETFLDRLDKLGSKDSIREKYMVIHK